MPYISCNGTTYSRYDQRPVVKECIRKERAAQEKAYKECMATPACVHKINQTKKNVMIGGGVLLVVLLIVAYLMAKEFNRL